MVSIRKFLEGIGISPKTSTTVTVKGELEVIDGTGKLQYHNGTTVSPVVTEAHTATLTNKTLTAPTITTPTMDVVNWDDQATPANPSAGFFKTYVKSDGKLYVLNSSGTESLVGPGGTGDVVGPASATDNAIVRFDGTTGKLVQNTTNVTITDTGLIGIGTTATVPLDIATADSGADIRITDGTSAKITLTSGAVSADIEANSSQTALRMGTSNAHAVSLRSGGSNRLTLGASGGVLIGAGLLPGAALDITDLNATASIRITDATNGARIRLVGPNMTADILASTGDEFQLGPTGAYPMILRTSGADRLTINAAGDVVTVHTADLVLSTAGKGLSIKSGSNAKIGTATLVGGTVTVSNTSVTANSLIFLTSQADGGTPGFVRVTAKTASTSFVITSSDVADTSTVAWMIVEAP